MLNLINKKIIDKINTDILLQSTIIEEYVFNDNISIPIGYITVKRLAGEVYIELKDVVTKEYLNEWNKDVGRLLVRDLKKNNLNYLEVTTSEYRALLRRISDDEYQTMLDNNFVHLMIGDYYYTIIKEVPITLSFTQGIVNTGCELLNSDLFLSESADNIQSTDESFGNSTEGNENTENANNDENDEKVETLSLF